MYWRYLCFRPGPKAAAPASRRAYVLFRTFWAGLRRSGPARTPVLLYHVSTALSTAFPPSRFPCRKAYLHMCHTCGLRCIFPDAHVAAPLSCQREGGIVGAWGTGAEDHQTGQHGHAAAPGPPAPSSHARGWVGTDGINPKDGGQPARAQRTACRRGPRRSQGPRPARGTALRLSTAPIMGDRTCSRDSTGCPHRHRSLPGIPRCSGRWSPGPCPPSPGD